MSLTVPALLTPSAGAPFERGTVERRELGEHDVLIDIAYAGICHSDIHQAREEWGKATFPMVPGHEIAGVISAVGSGVTKHAVGDRAGVGCFVDSCRECEMCLAGEEQFCLNGNVGTYNSKAYDGSPTYGGYSTQIVVDENYVLRIPRGHLAGRRRTAAVRRDHALLAAEALGCRPGQEGRHRRHGRARAHGRAARARARRRGHRAQPVAVQAGRRARAGRRPLLRDERPPDLPGPAPLVRPDHQHRRRGHRRRRVPVAAAVRGVARVRRAAREQAVVPRLLADRRLVGTCPGPTSAASARPRRCSTSARSTGSRSVVETITADDVDKAYDRVVEQRRPLPLRHRHVDDPGG